MERRLADFCDSEWQRMLDAACLEAVLEAATIVSVPAETGETITGLFRLPRTVITQATAFAQENAEACLRSRQDVAAMPVADPWDARRQAALEERVSRVLERLARLVEHHWALTGRATEISRYVAEGELLRELAGSWEEGQRAYHRALQAGDGAPPRSARASQMKSARPPRNKPRHRPDASTEELLRELLGTREGTQSILAARTIDGVADLIGRSHGAVGGSEAWKKEIKPMMDRLKAERAYARLEFEERRCDRHRTD